VNPTPGTTGSSTIAEIFVKKGRNLIQLTTFGRVDTTPLFLNVNRTRAFFTASAAGNCQLFSIGTLGTGLRQLTHFNPGNPGMGAACFNPFPPNCSVGQGGLSFQDRATNAVIFESGCDPLHANPFGEQVFAMRPDGSGLRQLTDAGGFTENPDRSFRVELPGPYAYSAAIR